MATRLRSAAVAGVGFALGSMLTVYAAGASSTVVASWPQPPSVSYQSFDPYTLYVVRSDPRLPWREPLHEVRIIRGGDVDGYGYVFEASLHAAGPIEQAQVHWSREGVALGLPSGLQVFFPEAAFTGGR
jgi:hypothetical protein